MKQIYNVKRIFLGGNMKKTVFVGILSATVLAVCCMALLINKETEQESSQPKPIKTEAEAPKKPQETLQAKDIKEESEKEEYKPPVEIINKGNLYPNVSNNQLPLSAIIELSKLPDDVQEDVDEIIEASRNIFMLKKIGDKVIIIVENPSDSRHNIDLKEISLNSESEKNIPFGSHIAGDETEQDIWEYEDDDDTKRPIKHIKFNGEKNIEYTETWNYTENEPIKYEMRDGDDRVISIKKETIDNETSLRVEHILYNSDGNTKVSVSITYNGPDITRFTYYNSEKPDEGICIFSNFGEDGCKTKETLYTPDFKLINSFVPIYQDGSRTGIKVMDNNENKVEELLAK